MRAFIAVEIPKEIKEKIAKLQSELPVSDKIKLVKPEIIHITLKFLGEMDEKDTDEIKRIVSSVRFDPFPVDVTGVGVFPSEQFVRVVWIGADNEKLTGIAKELDKRLESFGFRSEKFVSHLTIARLREKVDLQDFLSKHKNDYFGQFEVKEIKLKKSTLTSEGPIYSDL